MAQAIAQKNVTQKYGPYGSKNNVCYSFQLQEGEFIKEVIIRHGFIVDAIGFIISNPCGGTHTKFYGGCKGGESKLSLRQGEKITKLSGTYGNYKYQRNECLIATIKIHTNQNPNGYGPFGRGEGVDYPQKFETPTTIEGPIVGFFGSHNNYLQSIGIIVERKQVTTTYASMTNETNTGTLKFQENKDWSGSVSYEHNYPKTILDNQTTKFYHQGSPDGNSSQGGSMGAVIYVGPNKVGGPDTIAWLVGWSVPGNTNSNKVFVDCGPKQKFRHVNWDSVRSKIRSSGSEKEYTDPNTGASVYANIENNEPKPGYELDVTFSVKN